jgi:uncharacterized protein YqeY
MALAEQIRKDITEAMKAKDSARLNALRMVQAAFKNREIELRPNTMPEDEYLGVIKKLVKQRKESIEQFGQAGRQDLVDNETAELKLLETYMPAQLSREQIEKIVADVIAATGATSVKQMGQVMKEAQVKAAGQADNKIMSEIIKSKLQP